MRIDLDLLTFLMLLSSMLLMTYLMMLISSKLGKDMKKRPTDGSLILVWVKPDIGFEVTGPVVVHSYENKMKTTIDPIRINDDDITQWIPLGHEIYFGDQLLGISKNGLEFDGNGQFQDVKSIDSASFP